MAGSGLVAWPKDSENTNVFYVQPFGVVLLCIQLAFSACAAIFNEWVYKNVAANKSINLQNLSMYMWGILLQLFIYSNTNVTNEPFFNGFNVYTWASITCYAMKGLLVGMIFKYYSSIVKLLVNGASMFVANFLTWYIFGLHMNNRHVFGLITVCAALV
eukprot:UN27312